MRRIEVDFNRRTAGGYVQARCVGILPGDRVTLYDDAEPGMEFTATAVSSTGALFEVDWEPALPCGAFIVRPALTSSGTG